MGVGDNCDLRVSYREPVEPSLKRLPSPCTLSRKSGRGNSDNAQEFFLYGKTSGGDVLNTL